MRTMRPIQPIPAATVHCGDALRVLTTFDDATFDALITDPPYSSGGMYRSDRAASPADKYQQHEQRDKYLHFPGDGRDQRSWFAWCSLWLSECFRVLRPGARAYMFCDWRQLPTATDAFQAGGFVWRGLIAWDKGAGARAPHKGYHRHQGEYLLWGTKGNCPISTHGGPWPGVYQFRVDQADKHHMTGKPTPLMVEVCKTIPAGLTILDPFAGSGTTLVAAVRTGHHAVGIEMDPGWAKVTCQRLRKEATAKTADL
jgi:site-specific DNA-methyltransferase (adenine-specific)